jgi:tripartite-type tricarboxylate transporter receptor subunit TctC
MNRHLIQAGAWLFLTASAAGACAQSTAFPSKPLKIIVPFAPSGPNDIIARLVGQKLNDQWGHAVVIENRGGAGGTIGVELAAKSPADGYTLVMGGSSSLAVAPGLYARLEIGRAHV